jgi:hypothetical protein
MSDLKANEEVLSHGIADAPAVIVPTGHGNLEKREGATTKTVHNVNTRIHLSGHNRYRGLSYGQTTSSDMRILF